MQAGLTLRLDPLPPRRLPLRGFSCCVCHSTGGAFICHYLSLCGAVGGVIWRLCRGTSTFSHVLLTIFRLAQWLWEEGRGECSL